ncbi:TetR family transcriptional regulator [Streptomyces sp. 1114.5]|uniref:TetR/AcrR family transcriptional regulator n=1 Tax=Streptomyces sp. 1114.5 TaxID=1938830 RepID=UPI000EAE058D|nr:TetR/AcrR family transcriptional regulator [Streptomyces sp. 1114.5]RKT20226.1 TetR family transcriptional regulator [Streptomyces sp. 1114.5]
MGRPRGVDDVVILRAAARVMGRVGPAGLTLAAVAGEAGVVPGTLVQRFGSKRGLLLALADQSVRDADELIGRVRRTPDGALAALAELLTEATAQLATPQAFANHLAFLCADLADPQLHERALAVHHAQARAIGDLLAQAADTGELRAATDVPALTRTVQAVTAGAGLTWALEREGTLGQRLRRELDAALSPHRPPHRPSPRRPSHPSPRLQPLPADTPEDS